MTIIIHKKAITEKKSIKYLGILIDSTLSWKDHITNLSKKVSRTVGILYKLRPFVNLKIMKDIYYALFYSHLVYGIHVWGSACDSSLNIIQVLQKRVVRLMNQFLSIISTQFDIIAVTETSQRKINEEFYTNINLEGYTNFSTPTNTNKGGTIIYTKNT